MNRALSQAGIYASGLEAGNDLEELFLALTRSEAGTDPDGTFAGRPPTPAGPTDWAGVMRLFFSTIRKLIRRPATWVTFGLLAGLLVLIVLAVAATGGQSGGGGDGNGARRAAALLLVTFPGAYDLILSFILGLGGLFAVVYGAADRRLRVDRGARSRARSRAARAGSPTR